MESLSTVYAYIFPSQFQPCMTAKTHAFCGMVLRPFKNLAACVLLRLKHSATLVFLESDKTLMLDF